MDERLSPSTPSPLAKDLIMADYDYLIDEDGTLTVPSGQSFAFSKVYKIRIRNLSGAEVELHLGAARHISCMVRPTGSESFEWTPGKSSPNGLDHLVRTDGRSQANIYLADVVVRSNGEVFPPWSSPTDHENNYQAKDPVRIYYDSAPGTATIISFSEKPGGTATGALCGDEKRGLEGGVLSEITISEAADPMEYCLWTLSAGTGPKDGKLNVGTKDGPRAYPLIGA